MNSNLQRRGGGEREEIDKRKEDKNEKYYDRHPDHVSFGMSP